MFIGLADSFLIFIEPAVKVCRSKTKKIRDVTELRQRIVDSWERVIDGL